jgi:hypothetical protein
MEIKGKFTLSRNLLISACSLIFLSIFSIELGVLALLVIQYFVKRSIELLIISFVLIAAAWFVIDLGNTGPQSAWKITFLIALFVLTQKNTLIASSTKKEYKRFDSLMILFLILLHTLIILQGEKSILRNLLIGYDNVGHFSMLKTLANCGGFLTNCNLTGIATPEGYRNYPQYFHYSLSSYMNVFSEENRLLTYFVISSTVYILLVFFMFRIFNFVVDTPINNRSSLGTKTLKSRSKKTPGKKSYSKKQWTIPFKILILLGVTYIHSLGYLNFEYSILLLIVWVSCIQQRLLLNPLTVSLFLFMASSSSYPLIVIPCCLIFCGLILNRDYKFNKVFSTLYCLAIAIFTFNKVLGNLSTNSQYITSEGGSSEYMVVILGLVACYLYFDLVKQGNLRNYFHSTKLLSLINSNFFVFAIFLYLFNLIRGESPGYYTQKMCMILMLFIIPDMYISAEKSGLLARVYNQLVLKILTSVIVVLLSLNVSPQFLYGTLKEKFFFVVQPAIYIRELLTLNTSKDSQSSRIVQASKLSEGEKYPLLIFSESAVQDTIWVNAIRSTWGAELERRVIEGVLTDSSKTEPAFISEDDSYQVSVLKIGKLP